MGLDMYLSRRTYVQNWDFMKPEERHTIAISRGGTIRSDIKPERISYVIEQVAYWRKSNQIHAWFVKHVQDGKDECQEAYVSREQLGELLELCQTVIESPERAAELLPTQPGFFFGGTEYGDDYFDDLKQTIEMLKGILAEPDNDGSFYYRSSW